MEELIYVGPDRRRYEHLLAALPVRFKVITGVGKVTLRYEGKTRDISGGGIFLESPVFIKNLQTLGTKLELEIDIPTAPEPVKALAEVGMVKVRGQVRWIEEPKPDGAYKLGVGIKFTKIRGKDRSKILTYIRAVECIKSKSS